LIDNEFIYLNSIYNTMVLGQHLTTLMRRKMNCNKARKQVDKVGNIMQIN